MQILVKILSAGTVPLDAEDDDSVVVDAVVAQARPGRELSR